MPSSSNASRMAAVAEEAGVSTALLHYYFATREEMIDPDHNLEFPTYNTALTGRRVPLTDANLARLTLKYPLVTLRVITLIHWHALKLWWKNVPWHRKAANPQLQRGVFNAHESLRGQTREGKG